MKVTRNFAQAEAQVGNTVDIQYQIVLPELKEAPVKEISNPKLQH